MFTSKRPLAFLFLIVLTLPSCVKGRRVLVEAYSFKAKGDKLEPDLRVSFDGRDAKRPKILVGFLPVGGGFLQPTDLQFVPDRNHLALVLEKEGHLKWLDLEGGKSGLLKKINVLTASEEGLLGAAFHPKFRANGRVFLNYVAKLDGEDCTIIAEFFWRSSELKEDAFKFVKILLQQKQPYPNHNAGQLAFGADGFLYVGFGDGGWRDDPDLNAQNPSIWLGKMLRLDVDKDRGKAEIFASGLRNPWRYSFGPQGELIVADVGQDLFEEISVVEKGGNYGWNIREGKHCFKKNPKCDQTGLVAPIYEYPRDEGQSITGGYVYTGKAIPKLRGMYVFADFASGRFWALAFKKNLRKKLRVEQVYSLGHWPLNVATFGQDANGEVYAADFGSGAIYRIIAK